MMNKKFETVHVKVADKFTIVAHLTKLSTINPCSTVVFRNTDLKLGIARHNYIHYKTLIP